MKVRLAIPSKGRLRAPSIELLKNAGISSSNSNKSLLLKSNDPELEIVSMRASDIPKLVEKGVIDIGITGYDFIKESDANVQELLDLGFGQARVVLACKNESTIRRVSDIEPGSYVATKYTRLTKKYFKQLGIEVKVIKVSGATEIVPTLGIAQLIVDVVATGETLRMHGLRVVDVLLETSARLIANKTSLCVKGEKINKVKLALESILLAKRKKLIMMNVPAEALEAVIRILPSMTGPTIAEVKAPRPTWEVYSVVDEAEVYKLISDLKKVGAKDIIVVPLERIVR